MIRVDGSVGTEDASSKAFVHEQMIYSLLLQKEQQIVTAVDICVTLHATAVQDVEDSHLIIKIALMGSIYPGNENRLLPAQSSKRVVNKDHALMIV